MLGGAVVVSAFSLESFQLVKKPAEGATQVAAALTSDRYIRSPVLVSSPSASGEGAIIAETAMRSPVPTRRIIRASKLLAAADWDARGYRSLTQNPGEVLRFLSDAGIKLVVWQRPSATGHITQHHLQVAETLRRYPEQFDKIIRAEGVNTFDLYEIVGPAQH
ncbi:MAG: hypothetical protein WKF37_15195 [Bryobacteraceae bacterium]